MRVTFKIHTHEFDRALRQYMEYTRRALPDVLNKKGLYIARGALRLTPSTQAATIKNSLGQVIIQKKGSFEIKTVKAEQSDAPLAALIINARRGRSGEKGLYGPAMAVAIKQMIGARNKSRAFLKSGWIPAIRTLGPLVKQLGPGAFGGAHQFGADKGSAIPARAGFRCKVIIENSASGPHETNEALVKYGQPALQEAFNNEVASMLQYVADKQYEEAKKAGIKAFVN